MAGLLDLFDNGDAQLGLGLLGAAAPRADGAGFGQRLMEGVQGAQGMRTASTQRQMQQLQFQSAMRRNQMINDAMAQDAGSGQPQAQQPAGDITQPAQAAGGLGVSPIQSSMPAQQPAQSGAWPMSKIRLFAMSGDPGLQKAAELEQARQLAGQTDVSKLLVQAGIDVNSPLGKQITQTAIKKATYQAPTRLGEGAYADSDGNVQGLPTTAPAGFINVKGPDGSWTTQPVSGGTEAVRDSAAASSVGKATTEFTPQQFDPKTNLPLPLQTVREAVGSTPAGGAPVWTGTKLSPKAVSDLMVKVSQGDPDAIDAWKAYTTASSGQSSPSRGASVLPMGVVNNNQLLQGQGGDLLKAAQGDAAGNRQTSAYFDDIEHQLASGAKFGPMQADIAKWKAMVPGVDLSGAQTNQDVMRKIASNLAGARSTRSDAELLNWQKAYPNGEMTNDAIKQVLPMLRQTIAVSDARSKVLTNASANGLENLPKVANEFNQAASPAIVAAGQQLAAASAAGKTAEFLAQFKAQNPKDWNAKLQAIKKLDGMGAF